MACCKDETFTAYHLCYGSLYEEEVSDASELNYHSIYGWRFDRFDNRDDVDMCKTRYCADGVEWGRNDHCGHNCRVSGCGCQVCRSFIKPFDEAYKDIEVTKAEIEENWFHKKSPFDMRCKMKSDINECIREYQHEDTFSICQLVEAREDGTRRIPCYTEAVI